MKLSGALVALGLFLAASAQQPESYKPFNFSDLFSASKVSNRFETLSGIITKASLTGLGRS